MTKIYNKEPVKFNRRELRTNSTSAEKLLWKHLRKKQLLGYRFLRQYSVNNYILDFYCPKAKLGIELDGSQHAEDENAKYDRIRSVHIAEYNIKLLRFWNSEVYYRLDNVLETITFNLELNESKIPKRPDNAVTL